MYYKNFCFWQETELCLLLSFCHLFPQWSFVCSFCWSTSKCCRKYGNSITVVSPCHTPVTEPALLLHVLPRGWRLYWQLSKEAGSATGCWLEAPDSSNAVDSPMAKNQSRSAATRWGDLQPESQNWGIEDGLWLKCGQQWKCSGCTAASSSGIISKSWESFG